jgi:hypothetical protein
LKIEDIMLHSTTRWQPPFGVEINGRRGVIIKETALKRTVENM